ncbi:MAG: hypothetical protein LBD57_05825, partial [Endomicrobium sp.]|uniref:hypothetical protein n=1 Tax=Candidatus Endomicrobiellum cubanum TaxID=3242325 RepID=UPI002826D5AC|nr:hypothetical protein [Endomicrobium sp.]
MVKYFFCSNAKLIANLATVFIPFKYIRKSVRKKLFKKLINNELIKNINKIIQNNKNPIIIYLGLLSYFDPMTQRPHHIFRKLADKGFIIFWPDYKVLKLTKVADNIYIFPVVCIDTMLNIEKDKIIYIVAHYYLESAQYFISLLKQVRKLKIIYDYIDDLSLFGKSTQKQCQKVLSFVKNANALFLASADKLYDELARIVPKDSLLSSKNAVNIEDFHRKQYTLPIKLNPIV